MDNNFSLLEYNPFQRGKNNSPFMLDCLEATRKLKLFTQFLFLTYPRVLSSFFSLALLDYDCLSVTFSLL